MPRRHRPPIDPPPALTRAEADIEIMLALMNMVGMWRVCYRACRRRKACASPDVKCFDHNIERVRALVDDLAGWRRLDGPRPLAERVEPVDELFD